MKKNNILIIFLFWVSSLAAQKIERIEIFYLPFNLHIEGEVTIDLIKNYPKYSKSLIIRNDEVISSFQQAMSLTNLIPKKDNGKKFIPYMVIDVYLSRPRESKFDTLLKKTIYLNSKQMILFFEHHYHKNLQLEKWLNSNIFNKK